MFGMTLSLYLPSPTRPGTARLLVYRDVYHLALSPRERDPCSAIGLPGASITVPVSLAWVPRKRSIPPRRSPNRAPLSRSPWHGRRRCPCRRPGGNRPQPSASTWAVTLLSSRGVDRCKPTQAARPLVPNHRHQDLDEAAFLLKHAATRTACPSPSSTFRSSAA